jgi:hypothetical protein
MLNIKRSLGERLLKTRPLIEKCQNFLITNNLEEPKPRIAVYPYISGDAFMALTDIVHLNCQTLPSIDIKAVGETSVHFFEIEGLSFERVARHAGVNNVIIFHNGDEPLASKIIEYLREQKCLIFATNTARQEGFIEPIPIGIENAHHRRNGSIHYYNPLHMANTSFEKKRDVLVSFSVNTNPAERSRIVKLCERRGYKNEKLSLVDFRKKLSASRFVISPPGNGVDCHRTWEAMYHRAVPVIEKKYDLFPHLHLPLLSVESYDDFFDLSIKERHDLYNQTFDSGKSYPAMYINYWINKIHAFNKSRAS